MDRIDSFFGGLGVRGRVVTGQLPLTVTVVLVVVVAAVFSPATFADNPFRMALLAHAALFVLCAVPISKTIIEGHGGSISLTSTPDVGTTVTFTMPTA